MPDPAARRLLPCRSPPGKPYWQEAVSLFLLTKEGAMDAAERARLAEEIGELARAYDMKFAG